MNHSHQPPHQPAPNTGSDPRQRTTHHLRFSGLPREKHDLQTGAVDLIGINATPDESDHHCPQSSLSTRSPSNPTLPKTKGVVTTMKRPLFAMLAGLSALTLAANAWAGGDPVAGKAAAVICAGCHGVNGEGRPAMAAAGLPAYPRLAGQIEDYLVQTIGDYKNGVRTNVLMGAMAKSVQPQDVKNIAAYYAALK